MRAYVSVMLISGGVTGCVCFLVLPLPGWYGVVCFVMALLGVGVREVGGYHEVRDASDELRRRQVADDLYPQASERVRRRAR